MRLTCARGPLWAGLFGLGLLVGCSSDEDAPAGNDAGTASDAGDEAQAPGAGGSDGTGGTNGSGGTGGESVVMDATAPDASSVPAPPDYTNTSTWLCYPGAETNHCLVDLDATSVAPDGTLTVEPHEVADDPPFDCFYVYPTISADPGLVSDLEPDPEIAVVQQQAARLNSLCEMYAPIYRQVTLGGIFGGTDTAITPEEARAIAYGDVLAAWEHYLEEKNQGRAFVLIGHSQGAGHLNRIIRENIDGDATLRDRLIGAYLLGSSVSVPEGMDVGGDFANIPACRATDQTGCVVSYATFREDEPPPDDSFFGRPRTGTGTALCVNPAAPSGGAAGLKPYFLSDGAVVSLEGLDPITTPYVTFPDFFDAECVIRNGFSILELTILADPTDPRPDNIGGNITPQWGLHLLDANVAMGDIVDFVDAQWQAYSAP